MTASPVLVPHAGGVSNPRSSSGPADSSCIFAPQGQPIHPGLVSLPGSQSILFPLAYPQYASGAVLPRAAGARVNVPMPLFPDANHWPSPLATKGDA